MSATRRPSSVTALRQAIGTATPSPAGTGRPPAKPAVAAGPVKPVRVTLNLPPDLFRQIERFATTAAAAIGAPRVGVQDAMRAMLRVGVDDDQAGGLVLAEIRRRRDNA